MYCYDTCVCFFFFFSSRRRHTRYWRDWSSDVCSSDLTSSFPLTAKLFQGESAETTTCAGSWRGLSSDTLTESIRNDGPVLSVELQRVYSAVWKMRCRERSPRGLATDGTRRGAEESAITAAVSFIWS